MLQTQHPTPHWGINISSTQIEGIIIDNKNPAKTLCRLCIPTDRFCGYEHVINKVQLLVKELERSSEVKRPEEIGIATTGFMNPFTDILRHANTSCLNNHFVRADLSNALNMQVILANDANCFTLGEALLGSGRNYNTVVGVILETGVGSGIVVRGQLLQGLHGIAGEWSRSKMRGNKNLCHCGHKECGEMLLSEPALERFYEEITGTEVSLSEIVKKAKLNEVAALQTLEQLQQQFSAAIGNLISILDPEVIVLGGRVGMIDLLYTQSTRDEILRHIYSNELKTPLLRSVLGDSAAAFGAALLHTVTA